MEKFLTKETLIIAVVVFMFIVQSNYFATRLDLANLKNELKDYVSSQNSLIDSKVDKKLDDMNRKLDMLLKSKG